MIKNTLKYLKSKLNVSSGSGVFGASTTLSINEEGTLIDREGREIPTKLLSEVIAEHQMKATMKKPKDDAEILKLLLDGKVICFKDSLYGDPMELALIEGMLKYRVHYYDEEHKNMISSQWRYIKEWPEFGCTPEIKEKI